MKKFFTLLFAAVSGMCAMAQGITSLDEVEADAVYTIGCARGYLTVDGDYTKIAGNQQAEINTTFDVENPDFQFKFVEADGEYYLYHVGSEAYVDLEGNLVDLEEAAPIYFRAWEDGTVQPYWEEAKNLNLGGSKQVSIGTWKQKDEGDSFQIIKVELLNYDVVVTGFENGGVVIGEDTYANGDKAETYAVYALAAAGVEAEGYTCTVSVEGTTITATYKKSFMPVEGKLYVLKTAITNEEGKAFYLSLTPGSDAQGTQSNWSYASLGGVGTPLVFTGTAAGFTLQAEDGKWLGCSQWNVKNESAYTWHLDGDDEQGYYILRPDGKGLGMDNFALGKGLYTDKGADKRVRWFFEEYVAPEETHVVTLVVDDMEEVEMLEDGEGGYWQNVNLEVGEHVAVIYVDGEETATKQFETYPYLDSFDNKTVREEGVVTVMYKDGEVTFDGNPMSTDVITSIKSANASVAGAIYDLQGRRTRATKGFFIQNGVKVIR